MSTINDLTTIGSAYGATTLIGVFLHLYEGMKASREANAKRDQERWMAILAKSYEDVEKAREEVPKRDKTHGFFGGSFIGWTRRLLAWIVILVFVAFIIGELHDVPINLVYEVPKHFLFWDWTHYLVKTVQGIVWSPYIRSYCDMVLGFYMGHFTVKSFRS